MKDFFSRQLPMSLAAGLATLSVAGCGSAGTTTTTVTQRAALSPEPASAIQSPQQTAGASTAGASTAGTSTAGASTAGASASPSAGTPAPAVPKPRIAWNPIPFGSEREEQMIAYARRHYGSFMSPTYRLIDPHVIVIHYTETPSFQSTYNTFAPDHPDPELHELPNTCAHFVIDKDGTIHQLVSLGIMCRHTVGLNWTAIGIEHVGYGDQEVLADNAQITSSIRLVRWLRCRYHIAIGNVIGHNESLASPYHREDVPSLRTQTHSDFNREDMQSYRHRLAAGGPCPRA